MLKIREFIMTNSNWLDLLAREPYSLRIKEKDNLVMFNYTQGVSRPCDIVNEARGLILEKDSWKVVRYGFYRFYNLYEEGAAQLDSDSIEVQEKIDGSLVMFYWYNGWHMSTRSTFDACDAELSSGSGTFEDVIKIAMENSGVKFSQFSKTCTYVFELVSPETQVIISYNETKLYYLMTRNNNNLEESWNNIYNWPTFKTYKLKTLVEIENFVNSFEGKDFEGVVVKDRFNNRVKIKNLNWLKLHKMFNNGRLTKETILEMLMSGEVGEFLSYWPEKKEDFKNVRVWYENLLECAELLDRKDYPATYPNRKDFAEFVSGFGSKWRALMFKAYDGKAFPWVNGMSAKEFCRVFG